MIEDLVVEIASDLQQDDNEISPEYQRWWGFPGERFIARAQRIVDAMNEHTFDLVRSA